MKYTLSVFYLLASLALFTGAYISYKKSILSGPKNQADCEAKMAETCKSDSNCCGIWDDNVCRKGTKNGLLCESKGNVLPLILIIAGVLFFIAFLYKLITTFRSKSDK